jgi:hypothetical protein
MKPDHAELAAHLHALEGALLDPAVRRDSRRVAELLAEDFREFGSSGRVWSREATLDLLGSEDYKPLTIEDFECDCLAEGIALVTYRTVRVDAVTGARAVALRSSIWILESGQWRIRFHQGTRCS